MSDDSRIRARASWLRARQELGGNIVALEFGDTASAVALGGQSESARVIPFALGVAALARRYFATARPGEAAIEAAIAEAEERIMPLRPFVPLASECVTRDRRVAAIVEALGLQPQAWVPLSTETVEAGFQRWVAIALGRPATQDTLPTSAEFGAGLLALREWLHHLGFAAIRAADPRSPGASEGGGPDPRPSSRVP